MIWRRRRIVTCVPGKGNTEEYDGGYYFYYSKVPYKLLYCCGDDVGGGVNI